MPKHFLTVLQLQAHVRHSSANRHLALHTRCSMTTLVCSYLLHRGNLAASSMQGSPQGRVRAPRLALENLLLNLVQMLHHVPRQALLGADKHLDYLQTQNYHKGFLNVNECKTDDLSLKDLKKVERSQFEDVDDPRKGSLGAVGEQDHLQTTGHQGAVEDVLFQQNLPKKTQIYIKQTKHI